MPNFTTPHGISSPRPEEFVKDASLPAKLASDLQALAETAALAITEEGLRIEGVVSLTVKGALRIRPISDLPTNVDDWVGEDYAGIFLVPSSVTMEGITGRPEGMNERGTFTIIPLGTGGSMVHCYEYAGEQRVWSRSVSVTPANNTAWKRQDRVTRRVLHQLSQPGAPTLTDAEPARHVRLPFVLGCSFDRFSMTFKNYNERSGTVFGALDFVDVWVGKRAKDAFGNYTANFAEEPTNLGRPVATGSPSTLRYVLENVNFRMEANTEYIFAYGYTDPDASPNHLGIGGSYLGTNPAGVASMSVTNAWSQYTPLDVYLHIEAPAEARTRAILGSSSETGLNTHYPLRDNWAWRAAIADGVLPVMLGQSGQTMQGHATGFIWSKLAVFDRVDEVWVCDGSNDIYAGATQAELATRFETLVDKARDVLSENVFSVDIFPRAVETAAAKASRIQHNAYRRTLPHGIIAVFDRTRAVTGANGLMKPEYNSGDNTHLNTAGQHQMSAGIVTGEFQNSYTVSEVSGRTVSVWDYINGREQLIYSDTGWRAIDISDASGTVRSSASPGTMHLRREGSTVTARFAGIGLTAGTAQGNLLSSGTIPTEFRGVADGSFFSLRDTGIGFAAYHTLSVAGSYVRWIAFWDGAAQSQTRPVGGSAGGEFSWHTDAPWPTTLPGTAVGTIPYQ